MQIKKSPEPETIYAVICGTMNLMNLFLSLPIHVILHVHYKRKEKTGQVQKKRIAPHTMELIRTYRSNSYSGDDDDHDRENSNGKEQQGHEQEQEQEQEQRLTRSVYLLTYERTKLNLFPTRKSFAEAVLDGFTHTATRHGKKTLRRPTVEWWVCSRDSHEYCIALKLSAPVQCFYVQRYLAEHFKIKVVFSHKHLNYYSAYEIVSSKDKNIVCSKKHPDLCELDCIAR